MTLCMHTIHPTQRCRSPRTSSSSGTICSITLTLVRFESDSATSKVKLSEGKKAGSSYHSACNEPHRSESLGPEEDSEMLCQAVAECLSGYSASSPNGLGGGLQVAQSDTSDSWIPMLRSPQHFHSCPVGDKYGLPVHEILETWKAEGYCGVRFNFACGHNVFRTFKRFWPSHLGKVPAHVQVGEKCILCGGSGVWNGVDVGFTECGQFFMR